MCLTPHLVVSTPLLILACGSCQRGRRCRRGGRRQEGLCCRRSLSLPPGCAKLHASPARPPSARGRAGRALSPVHKAGLGAALVGLAMRGRAGRHVSPSELVPGPGNHQVQATISRCKVKPVVSCTCGLNGQPTHTQGNPGPRFRHLPGEQRRKRQFASTNRTVRRDEPAAAHCPPFRADMTPGIASRPIKSRTAPTPLLDRTLVSPPLETRSFQAAISQGW